MVTERQCRICGEWKLIDDHFRYAPKRAQRNYWCKGCNDEYGRRWSAEQDVKQWVRSMQTGWDYIKGKTEPDR